MEALEGAQTLKAFYVNFGKEKALHFGISPDRKCRKFIKMNFDSKL